MARFALFTNGVKVETLNELKENFNIKDMLENYRNKALHRWLMVNRMTGELSQVEAITATGDDVIIDELIKIFGVSVETIEEQKRVLEEKAKKSEEVLSEREKELLTDIERVDFLKYMDDTSDVQNIIALLRKHAEKSNPVAQLKLGWCFENERGIEKNSELAVEYYRKSAEQGLARAQNQLGYCFQNGIGVAKDNTQAVFWYQKSADQDFHLGLFNLGCCYESGAGVEKDLSEAVKLYTASAEKDNADAEYQLGYCYQEGVGVEKNPEKAAFWFRKSAEHGNSSAQNNLGYCYGTGTGVEENQTEAVKWYRKAAEQGNMSAQFNLGCRYETGRGVDKNLEQSKTWYLKSAAQGYTRAKLNLVNLIWFKDRINLQGGLSNFICRKTENYAGSYTRGIISNTKNMIVAIKDGIYTSKDIYNWEKTFDVQYFNSSTCPRYYSAIMGDNELYWVDESNNICSSSYPVSPACNIVNYTKAPKLHIFLMRWKENGINNYCSIWHGNDLNSSASFEQTKIPAENNFLPIQIIPWGGKYLFVEQDVNNSTVNRITLADQNFNRMQIVFRFENENGATVFSVSDDLAIAFMEGYDRESFYTRDGINWQPLKISIQNIVFVDNIYWAMTSSNGTACFHASIDGLSWKELGNITNFHGGKFVIGNKKLFTWDSNRNAFAAELEYYDK